MSLQEKMFSEVEMWLASGISKLDFLAGKEYSVAKFNCIPPSKHVFFSPKILLSFVGKYMFDGLTIKNVFGS
jgi:hypothetical protein